MQFSKTVDEPTVNDHPREEKKENFFVESKKLLEKYIQDRILLFKLEMSKKAATTAASVVNGVSMALFGLFAMIFLSITLGFVFSELTGSFIWGFAIVTLLYVALVVIMIVARKWISRKVSNAVVNAIYSGSKTQNKQEDDSYSSKN